MNHQASQSGLILPLHNSELMLCFYSANRHQKFVTTFVQIGEQLLTALATCVCTVSATAYTDIGIWPRLTKYGYLIFMYFCSYSHVKKIVLLLPTNPRSHEKLYLHIPHYVGPGNNKLYIHAWACKYHHIYLTTILIQPMHDRGASETINLAVSDAHNSQMFVVYNKISFNWLPTLNNIVWIQFLGKMLQIWSHLRLLALFTNLKEKKATKQSLFAEMCWNSFMKYGTRLYCECLEENMRWVLMQASLEGVHTADFLRGPFLYILSPVSRSTS